MRTPVPVALAGPEAHELPEASRGLTAGQGGSLSLIKYCPCGSLRLIQHLPHVQPLLALES